MYSKIEVSEPKTVQQYGCQLRLKLEFIDEEFPDNATLKVQQTRKVRAINHRSNSNLLRPRPMFP